MLAAEIGDGGVDVALGELAVGDVGLDLVELAGITQVGGAFEDDVLGVDAVTAKRRQRLRLHLFIDAVECGEIDVVGAADEGARVVLADIHRKHAEGAVERRHRRNHHFAYAQAVRDEAAGSGRRHRPRSTRNRARRDLAWSRLR